MPSLREIQDAFTQQLMNDHQGLAKFVATKVTPSAKTRIGVYQTAYRERLIEALANDYEMLHTLLGDEAFRQLCMEYIDKHPSTYYSLRWFGSQLAEFLGYSEDGGNHDWEAELAKLEWELIGAFDASDCIPANEDDIASIPPESWPELSVKFHPSVRLIGLWWNTLDLWQSAKDERQPPDPIRLNQKYDCLLWRNNLVTKFRSLEADEAVALSSAMAGMNFSDICGALAEELQDQEQVPFKAAGFFKTWLTAGIITQLLTP